MPSNEPPARCHQLAFSGSILERGFWLYIWKIKPPKGKALYYVGRTGDSSSAKAQSPFNRLSQHLGLNKRNNTLRRWLTVKGMNPEECQFRLVAVGPIMPEAPNMNKQVHQKRRDHIAAMECELASRVRAAGCEVLGAANCREPLDRRAFEHEFNEFVAALPELKG